ncbi:MAG: type II secretion system inner membrane protein GspF [Sphingomonadales bacterium]|nr:type II secretion system inner membrane protein GspF [Sphingomonadales bacterium]MBK8860242.1 type II secretion system inner membrane protein GspF [Sphingomonadales bacterium]MBL0001702.1 type II secretion system inner membrane protein GspF [Sphingomonadales bacterium]MBP7135041.1 type II secretion system inner membrane protein GspF [Sphingomonadaceae bacterium]
MTQFDYVALDVAGREKRGRMPAANVEEVREKLVAKRLYVVSIGEGPERAAAGAPLLSIGPKRLSAKELTLFTRQLATLVRVSPIEESLRTIARQTESEKARGVIDTVHGGVLEGRSLAEAMQREAKSFPQLYRAMVSAGEGAGSLPVILDRLADLQERQAQVRSKLFAALAYPLVLALVAMFVVGALMIYVVPKVVEQFDTVGQQLPLLTRVVIGVSGLLAGWWWAMLLVVGGLSFLCWRMLQDPARRLAFDLRLLRLPLIGRLIRDLHAARLARTLSTMVASRLPLIEGLALTSRTVRNHALRQASEQMVEAIRGGGSLSAALRRTGLFPPLLVYLTASGESSGQLDTMLERAADYLEREFDSFTAAALAMLEPAIIVVMGAIVAAIVLSILLPILQLESLAGV